MHDPVAVEAVAERLREEIGRYRAGIEAEIDALMMMANRPDYRIKRLRSLLSEPAGEVEPLGRADWLFDEELNCHIPCCTVAIGNRINEGRCHNGPLTAEQIASGDCGGHREPAGEPTPEPLIKRADRTPPVMAALIEALREPTPDRPGLIQAFKEAWADPYGEGEPTPRRMQGQSASGTSHRHEHDEYGMCATWGCIPVAGSDEEQTDGFGDFAADVFGAEHDQ